MRHLVTGILFVLVFLAGSALGEGCLTASDFPAFLGSFDYPGNTYWYSKRDPVFMGNTFFIPVKNAGIAVAELVDQDRIEILSQISTQDLTWDAALLDSTLYVAENSAGVMVYDVHDPAFPALITQFETPGNALDVEIVGNVLLVLDSLEGLLVFETENSHQTRIVSSIPLDDFVPISMQRSDELLIIQGEIGEYVFVDVSAAQIPSIVGQYDFFPRVPNGFAIKDEILAVSLYPPKVEFWSLETPSAPSLISQCQVPWDPRKIQFLNDHLFVSSGLYGLSAVDLSNIDQPKVVFRHNSDSHSFLGLGIIEDRVLAIGDKIDLIDFSLKSSPRVFSTVQLPNYWRSGLLIHNEFAYLSSGDSLTIVGLENPANPKWVHSEDFGQIGAMAAKGDVLYVTDYDQAELDVYDLSVPDRPVFMHSIDVDVWPHGLLTHENLLVVFHNWYFSLWDISTPANPQHLATRHQFNLYSGDIQGDYLYLGANYNSGLIVCDISNPTNPTYVANNHEANCPRSATAYGDALYVSDYTGAGVKVFDISNPEQPWLRYTLDIEDCVSRGYIKNETLYIRSGDGLINVIDIRDPFEPILLGSFGQSPRYSAMAGFDDFIAVTGSLNKLEIYEIQCGVQSFSFSHPANETKNSISLFPNPFNPRTSISFSIDHSQTVEICVFDLTGKRIAVLADRVFQAGDHSINWQGKDMQGRAMASGTYLVRMITEERTTSEKMVLIR